MLIKKFLAGPIGTNCYLLINENTKEAIIVDPASLPLGLMHIVTEDKLTVKAVLLTHGHFDHILGLDDVINEYGEMPVYVHEADKEMVETPTLNMSIGMGRHPYGYFKSTPVKDGQILEIAGLSIKVLHTPGHTPGGVCYYIADEDVLISGDTLFADSVGRTDFPEGSMMELRRAIKEKLFVLPDDTHVFPGHMGTTLIGHEKLYNPFI